MYYFAFTTMSSFFVSENRAAGVAVDDDAEPDEDPLTTEENLSEQEQMEKQFKRLGYPVEKTVIKSDQKANVVHEKADMILAMSTVEGTKRMFCFAKTLLTFIIVINPLF